MFSYKVVLNLAVTVTKRRLTLLVQHVHGTWRKRTYKQKLARGIVFKSTAGAAACTVLSSKMMETLQAGW